MDQGPCDKPGRSELGKSRVPAHPFDLASCDPSGSRSCKSQRSAGRLGRSIAPGTHRSDARLASGSPRRGRHQRLEPGRPLAENRTREPPCTASGMEAPLGSRFGVGQVRRLRPKGSRRNKVRCDSNFGDAAGRTSRRQSESLPRPQRTRLGGARSSVQR